MLFTYLTGAARRGSNTIQTVGWRCHGWNMAHFVPYSHNSAPYLSWLFAGAGKRRKTRRQKTNLHGFLRGGCLLCWRLPILPGRFQPSIVGTSELNCCVRDGNRCTLTVISTNYSVLAINEALRTEQRNLDRCEKKQPTVVAGITPRITKKHSITSSNL